MSLRAKRVIAPATDLVTLAEAKAQCRIDHTDDDATLLPRLMKLASAVVQERAGKALVTQDWTLSMQSATGIVIVPDGVCPVQSIQSVAYIDAAGVAQTATATDFEVIGDEDGAIIKPKTGKTWPVTNGEDAALVITLRSGFGTADLVPPNLIHAALMLISHWYEQREAHGETLSEVPDAVGDLIGLTKTGWMA